MNQKYTQIRSRRGHEHGAHKESGASFTSDVLDVGRGTVSKRLDAYDRYGLDGLADIIRLGGSSSCCATNWGRWYLKRSGGFVRLLLLPLYSSFLNPAGWWWHKSKARIRMAFRLSAKLYFRQKVMLVYELFEIRFNPRNILFRNLERCFHIKRMKGIMIPTKHTLVRHHRCRGQCSACL